MLFSILQNGTPGLSDKICLCTRSKWGVQGRGGSAWWSVGLIGFWSTDLFQGNPKVKGSNPFPGTNFSYLQNSVSAVRIRSSRG